MIDKTMNISLQCISYQMFLLCFVKYENSWNQSLKSQGQNEMISFNDFLQIDMKKEMFIYPLSSRPLRRNWYDIHI